jgi:predicted nucleic acid-binding protein
MKVVADTNVFIAVALNEPEKDLVIRLTKGRDLVAPEVLPFEIGNALTAMVKKRVLKADEMIAAWEAVRQISVELRAIDIRSALEIASRFGIYAYDAYFLECASGLRTPLLTLDKGMRKIAYDMDIKVLE